MSCWSNCNYKRSVDDITADRRQTREDTGKRMLFYEAEFTYQCCGGDDAIRFVSQKSKENLKYNNNNEEDKEEAKNLITMKMKKIG